MKKLLIGALLCTSSLALFSQEVKIGQSYSGETIFQNKPAHITILPDAQSAQHFIARIVTVRDTLEYRFFSTQKSIVPKDLEDLEKYDKIAKDGRCIVKQANKITETPYKMGKAEGTGYTYNNGVLFSKTVFENNRRMSETVFYPNGKLRADIVSEYNEIGALIKNNAVVEYYESGKVKREEVYSWENEFIRYKNYTEAGKDTLFTFPFMRPVASFPGGPQELMKFLANNLRYPAEAVKNGIQGRVIVDFLIEKDGSIVRATIAQGRGLNPECDKEAIRVVKKMPRFVPATQYGRPIPIKFTLPINFRLRN